MCESLQFSYSGKWPQNNIDVSYEAIYNPHSCCINEGGVRRHEYCFGKAFISTLISSRKLHFPQYSSLCNLAALRVTVGMHKFEIFLHTVVITRKWITITQNIVRSCGHIIWSADYINALLDITCNARSLCKGLLS